LPYQRLIAGMFVGGCPEHHLCKNGREIDSFPGEQVNYLAAVGWVRFRGDDSAGRELLQAVGQDIRCNSLITFQECFVRASALEHHVANDEQRPAIAQHFDRGVQRAR
jgi:hypothetical protein